MPVSSRPSKQAGLWAAIVLSALGTIALGTTSLIQISGFRRELAASKGELATARLRLSKLEANLNAAQQGPSNSKDNGDTRGTALGSGGQQPSLVLTREEIQLVRDFIKVPPPRPGAIRRINVGDILPITTLAALPELITSISQG